MAKHRSQLALLGELQDLGKASEAPAAAHTFWHALGFGLKEFADDLRAYVHLKNALLFPRFL
ncbi:hypothetical protein FA743_17230 [Paracoccus gahaiensis]|uniref:Uncharacterized protein n=1 Tax=Paracoccus gahaiensis TaxID=1706839 RepID=A0A4U0R533_9RHOB|nr:hypothetical protein FA743_17230 [Paracoccus gahaiensis]